MQKLDEEDLELFLHLFFEDFCEKPENFENPKVCFERLEEFVTSFNLLSASNRQVNYQWKRK